jgi:CHAD domain-containing protein
LEQEVKLVPGEGFRLSDLGEPLPARVLVATYHDTPDLRLARHRITFRHRVEDGARLWQLKIPTGASRIELEVPGTPARPPEELTSLLAVHLRGQPLVKVARLRTHRQVVRRDGAEIADDSVAVMEGPRVVRRFREIEIESLDGDSAVLERLEREALAAGAERGVFTPKLFRALDLAFEPESPALAAGATPGEELGAALAEQHGRLLDHDPGTRLGQDPEDLHQMRVATRRARAFLRAARDLLKPDWAEGLRAELGWLGSALGPARDVDVLLEHLREEVEGLGDRGAPAHALLASLERERERARGAVVAALTDERYFALLDRLELAAQPRLRDEREATSLADLWRREFKRTRRAFSALGPDSPDDELHVARIRVKRARYAAELAAPELGEPGERFVDAAKKLQDVLGEHQDSVVAESWILGHAERSATSREAVDLLVERQRERRRRARRAWPKVWDRLERRAREARR